MERNQGTGGSQAEAAAEGVTAEDIATAFEVMLGRPPTGPEDIAYHLDLGFPDRQALGDYLCATDEFQRRLDGLAAAGRLPARAPAEPALLRPATVFLGDRVLTHTHRGLRIYCAPTDVDLTPHLMAHGMWEPHVEGVLQRLLRPGQCALDVGANIGYHTLTLGAAVGGSGQVHAFEASPRLHSLLYASVFVNGMSSFVRTHPLAVMDRPGSITLASQPLHFGSGNVVPDREMGRHYAEAYSERTEVPAVALDAFLPADLTLDLLRIDIEGSEPQALRGAEALIRRSPNLRILSEWSVGMMAVRTDVAAYVGWLTQLDFRFWLVTGSGGLEPLLPGQLLDLPHSDVVMSRGDPGFA